VVSASITALAFYNFQSAKKSKKLFFHKTHNKPQTTNHKPQTTNYFTSVVRLNLKELKAKQTPENK
jgi:hypothetical protein